MSVHGESRRTGYDYGMTGSYSYGKHGNYDYGAMLEHEDQPIEQIPTWQFGMPYNPWTAHGPHSGKGPKRSDARLRDDVARLLHDTSWLDASDVDVQFANGEVTLTGTVATRNDKVLAERLAESVPGVVDIHNQLSINRDALYQPVDLTHS
ncbi:MAG: BON domain-containing protein [Micromonosporaceae bacterium]